jgi:opacity protein-like surface antigen
MKKTLLAITSAAAISSPAVLAADSMSNDHGLYLGANYGYLNADSDDDFDDDSDAYQGLIGYRFNQYFAAEGGYIDFDDYGNSLAKASTDGYTFALKGTLPLNEQFGLYVKVGQLWWETDYKVLGFDGSEEDEGLFYGAGVSFDITDNLVLNAEYIVYDLDLDADDISEDVEDNDFETDLEHASVGLEYRF